MIAVFQWYHYNPCDHIQNDFHASKEEHNNMRFEVLEKYFTLRSNGSIYMLNLLSKSSSRVSSGISGMSGTLGEMPALLMYSTTCLGIS